MIPPSPVLAAAPAAPVRPEPAGRRRHDHENFPRPARAFGPVAGTIFALGAWAAVAHNSGAGWVQALGALLAAFLFIGLAAPGFVVRRARCRVEAGPVDSTVGAPVSVALVVGSPLRLRPLDPPGPEQVTGRRHELALTLVPDRRGVVERCEIEVASAAPFGLLWWTKRVVVELPRPLLVAPRLGPADHGAISERGSAGEDVRRVDSRVGEPRGVRGYRPGDLRHWVHWPATAHTGSLMVREMESPSATPLRVLALLPDDPAAAERAAEVALGTVAQLLSAGRSVVLITAESAGVVDEGVDGLTDAGRRLARALPRPAAVPRTRAERRAAKAAASL